MMGCQPAGVAWCATHAQHASGLLHCADEAMYQAKIVGKGCYRVFNRSLYDRDPTLNPRQPLDNMNYSYAKEAAQLNSI